MSVNPVTYFDWRTWLHVLWRVVQSIPTGNLVLVAAGVAFFGFLSVFPALAAALSIWGIFAEPDLLTSGVEKLTRVVPTAAANIVDARLDEIAGASSDRLGIATLVSLLFALFWARSGISALMNGLNSVYRERSSRNPIKVALRAVLFTTVLTGMALIAVAATVIVPALLWFVPVSGFWAIVIPTFQWGLSTTILFAGLCMIYRYGPNRARARVQWVVPGAVLALVCWVSASVAVSLYVSNIADLNAVYGSIGAAIALMLWLFVSAFSILIGASLNAELELETRHDTTVPPEKPMGERGAFVADTTARKLRNS